MKLLSFINDKLRGKVLKVAIETRYKKIFLPVWEEDWPRNGYFSGRIQRRIHDFVLWTDAIIGHHRSWVRPGIGNWKCRFLGQNVLQLLGIFNWFELCESRLAAWYISQKNIENLLIYYNYVTVSWMFWMQLKIPETHNHSSGYKILKLSFYSIILLHGIFTQF